MSIEVKNVSRYYGRAKALDDVSFSIGRGEIAALLGPNGAGKTTMMKIITCFIPQHGGSVAVCGYDVVRQSLDVRHRIGYLPENNPLYHDMYISEYLMFVAGLYKLGRARAGRVREVIGITGLGSEAHKKIGALSKGYRQRVGLAQALVHDPDVLILDEPTSGLDPNQLSEIRQLIRYIGKEKTVLLSTHIMQEVEAICDRIIIMHKGQLVADAPTSEIRRQTQSKRVVTVTFEAETDQEALKQIDQVLEVVAEAGNTFRIYSEASHDLRAAIFRFAVNNQHVILEMKQDSESLEQVFRQLTR